MSADENTTITMTGLYSDDFQLGGQANMQGLYTTALDVTEVTGGETYYSYVDSTLIHLVAQQNIILSRPDRVQQHLVNIQHEHLAASGAGRETDLIVVFNRGGPTGSLIMLPSLRRQRYQVISGLALISHSRV